MKNLLSWIIAAALLMGGLSVRAQETDPDAAAKRADIKKLMKLTGAGDMAMQMLSQMSASLKKMNAAVPESFWTQFMAEANPDELLDLCVPSYEKHFTHDEITQLIAFYESPLGKKLIASQPMVMQECTVAGQEWGRKLGEKVVRQLQSQHP